MLEGGFGICCIVWIFVTVMGKIYGKKKWPCSSIPISVLCQELNCIDSSLWNIPVVFLHLRWTCSISTGNLLVPSWRRREPWRCWPEDDSVCGVIFLPWGVILEALLVLVTCSPRSVSTSAPAFALFCQDRPSYVGALFRASALMPNFRVGL